MMASRQVNEFGYWLPREARGLVLNAERANDTTNKTPILPRP